MTSGRVIGITVCAVVAALGLGAAGIGGTEAYALATRPATPAELTAAGAAGVAQRWEREPAASVFPDSVEYTTDLQTKERAVRLSIGGPSPASSSSLAAAPLSSSSSGPSASPSSSVSSSSSSSASSSLLRGCASVVDSSLRSLASRDHCVAGMRATYADALGGTVYTVGVLAFPSAASAGAFYNQVPVDPFPATGLRALPVPGTAAARFTDASRQALAAQQEGPYVVLAVGGYADGRPAASSGERRDAVFDPADNLVDAVAKPLAAPVTVKCGESEWTCSLPSAAVGSSLAGSSSPGSSSPGSSFAGSSFPGSSFPGSSPAVTAGSPAPPTSVDGIRPFVLDTLGEIGVPAAWNTSRGSGVTVGVLDSGVGADAPDLPGVVTNGPDFTEGADPAGYLPPHMHGTYISSIIAGRGTGPGNTQGVIGVAPESRILSVRVILDDNEPGLGAYENKPAYANAIGKGIYYAVDHGAKVINMSLGSGQPTSELRSAVAYAIGKGVVIVASAGNDGSGSGFAPYMYPASFSGVISVAAVTSGGARAPFSEQNASVVLSAPGGDWVMGDQPAQSWVAAEGTSPAAAFVSGVAALIKSRYPGLSPALVEQAMISSVTHRPPGGYDVYTGFGEISAPGALAAAGRLAAGHPVTGLPASARFAAAPGPIQVVHRDMRAVAGFSALGAGGLLCALAALTILIVLARRRRSPSLASGLYGAAGTVPGPSQWSAESSAVETWRDDDAPGF